MKKDFVTSINNGQKINPPLYLQPEACTVDGRTANHPWKSLSDEELLRSAGLILKDPERQMGGKCGPL